MRVDTSSAAAAATAVVGWTAARFAALIADPMLPTSEATAERVSVAAITYDMAVDPTFLQVTRWADVIRHVQDWLNICGLLSKRYCRHRKRLFALQLQINEKDAHHL
jgi:hypothetical protein|nr:hypothetical protein [Mycobacterium gordonae]